MLNNNYLELLMAVAGVTPRTPRVTAGSTRCATSGGAHRGDRRRHRRHLRDRVGDFGLQHYWSSHHPWVVPEPLTPEPCETYSKDDLDEWAAAIKKGSDEAYADAQFVLDSPHAQPIDQMRRTEAMEDPEQWAFTWRKYKKKFKDRV